MTATEEPSTLLATLGGQYYSSDSLFAAEQNEILETMWFCAARSTDLANPGQFRKIQVGSESVLIVRGRDGMLRASLNVRRHRGAQLCSGPEGLARRKNIRCPYHAWTYALDGKLVAAPSIATLTDETGMGIDRYRYGLVPVALTEWLGYAWVAWPTSRRSSQTMSSPTSRSDPVTRPPLTTTASKTCRWATGWSTPWQRTGSSSSRISWSATTAHRFTPNSSRCCRSSLAGWPRSISWAAAPSLVRTLPGSPWTARGF
jgi:phenylpropionate dioxygenase-like ring-hydroxylating dioxygenase large terminal subunit